MEAVAYRTKEQKQASYMSSLLCAPRFTSAHSSHLGLAPTTTHEDGSTRCPAATGTCRDTIGLHNTTVAAFIPFVFSLPPLTASTIYIDLMASWWPILPGSTYCVGGPPLASDGIEAAPPGGKCTNKTHFNLNSSFRSNSPQLCV